MGFPVLVRCHLYIESGPWWFAFITSAFFVLLENNHKRFTHTDCSKQYFPLQILWFGHRLPYYSGRYGNIYIYIYIYKHFKSCVLQLRVRSHVRFVRNPHGLLHFWLVTFQQEWSHGVHSGAVRPANQAKKLPQPRCQNCRSDRCG